MASKTMTIRIDRELNMKVNEAAAVLKMPTHKWVDRVLRAEVEKVLESRIDPDKILALISVYD